MSNTRSSWSTATTTHLPNRRSGPPAAISTEGPPARTEPAWYVIQCRANQNDRAQQNLENQGFTCFQPRLNVEKLRAGKRIQHFEPLFPGYLFIQLAMQGQSWHTIRSTRGVQRLVTFGNQAVPVPDEVIENLHLAHGANDDIPAIRPGDRLRIENGPFANLEAVFQRFDGQERVIVLLGLLQKQHQFNLSLNDIRRL